MPVISGLQTSLVRDANTAFATTFFPRYRKGVWSRVCGTTKSSSAVEPFALDGPLPILRQFGGTLVSQGMASFNLNVPNLLFKNFAEFRRREFEMDQTRTLQKSVGQLGVRVAEAADYLLANRILNGSTANSQYVTVDNTQYTMTFDAKPIYSTTHNNGDGTSQSNILQGHLPNTVAGVTGQDVAESANQIMQDLNTLYDAIAGVKDDKGALIYPDFDPKEHLVIMHPPCLGQAFNLLKSKGTIGGTNGQSSGATTNTGFEWFKEAIGWNMLKGVPDLTSENPAATVSPVNPTDWYAMIVGDFVQPWFYQRFMPKKKGETVPLGEDPEAQAAEALAAADNMGLTISPEAADVYAATQIDHNLGAIGANAQESVVKGEKLFMSARTYMQIFPGPWFSNWRLKPVSGS